MNQKKLSEITLDPKHQRKSVTSDLKKTTKPDLRERKRQNKDFFMWKQIQKNGWATLKNQPVMSHHDG